MPPQTARNNNNYRRARFFIATAVLLILSRFNAGAAPLIVDHTCTNLSSIPNAWISEAKSKLHIAYGHTSHGSQLTTGMSGLVSFKGQLYAYNSGGTGGALDLNDTPFSGASDLGNPNMTAWETATRNYLNAHPSINVVIWSWCGQVSSASQSNTNSYLNLMNGLETSYPNVKFVYMTGHLDGTGLTGNLHLRNEQIRAYCTANDKILYDFADIESYDPDGAYFGDKIPNDACDYDSNNDGARDANWAAQWQNSHTQGVDWYNCSSAHSEPLNANRKAYAAWWLWAQLAGWNSSVNISTTAYASTTETVKAFPNPYRPGSGRNGIVFTSSANIETLNIFTLSGELVFEASLGGGQNAYEWLLKNNSGVNVSSGIYIYSITNQNGRKQTGKVAIIR